MKKRPQNASTSQILEPTLLVLFIYIILLCIIERFYRFWINVRHEQPSLGKAADVILFLTYAKTKHSKKQSVSWQKKLTKPWTVLRYSRNFF